MSINSLLTMNCNIERSVASQDNYRNTTLSWNVTKTNAKCFINYIQETGNVKVNVSGESVTDLYKGFFFATEDIKVRDRISLSGIYYYVRFVSPIVNARLGVANHIECLLSTEEI